MLDYIKYFKNNSIVGTLAIDIQIINISFLMTVLQSLQQNQIYS